MHQTLEHIDIRGQDAPGDEGCARRDRRVDQPYILARLVVDSKGRIMPAEPYSDHLPIHLYQWDLLHPRIIPQSLLSAQPQKGLHAG